MGKKNGRVSVPSTHCGGKPHQDTQTFGTKMICANCGRARHKTAAELRREQIAAQARAELDTLDIEIPEPSGDGESEVETLDFTLRRAQAIQESDFPGRNFFR